METGPALENELLGKPRETVEFRRGLCSPLSPRSSRGGLQRGCRGTLLLQASAVDQRVTERQQLLVPSLLGVSIGNMHSDGRFPDSFFFARISSHSKQQSKAELT